MHYTPTYEEAHPPFLTYYTEPLMIEPIYFK